MNAPFSLIQGHWLDNTRLFLVLLLSTSIEWLVTWDNKLSTLVKAKSRRFKRSLPLIWQPTFGHKSKIHPISIDAFRSPVKVARSRKLLILAFEFGFILVFDQIISLRLTSSRSNQQKDTILSWPTFLRENSWLFLCPEEKSFVAYLEHRFSILTRKKSVCVYFYTVTPRCS